MSDRTTALAQGRFVVEIEPQGDPDVADGLTLGRMSLLKRYEGDLVATARGTMLTAMTPVSGSAAYVAIERVSGALHGRVGSFALQHAGSMQAGTQALTVTVVPDSGAGALQGMAGSLRIRVEGGQHFFELDYTLPG
jgi:hypothetical protein